MRRLLIMIATIATIQVNAQVSQESGAYTFHKAARAHGSQSELYNKAVQWVTLHYANTHAIKYQSEESGKIIVSGSFEHIEKGAPNKINYTLTVELRSGVFRETYSGFIYQEGSRSIPLESKKIHGKKHILADASDHVDKLSKSLINHMSSDVLATR